MSLLTAAEKEYLKQFRDRLADANLSERQNEDYYLVRWLRARDNDLDKAEDMLRQHLDWRKENDMDNILSWEGPKELDEWLPVEQLGFDDDNRPVLWVRTGYMKLRECANAGYLKEVIKFFARLLERCLFSAQGKLTRQGAPVQEIVLINDTTNLSLMTLANLRVAEIMVNAMKLVEQNFPETLHKIHVVNGGRAFSYMYALIKPLMSDRTADKMAIHGTNEEKWKQILRDSIPSDILPEVLGGTKAVTIAPPAPEAEPEAEAEPVELPLEARFLIITIPAGQKYQLSAKVESGDSSVIWAFKTDRYDIAFALNRDGKAYIEKGRVESHVSTQEGNVSCEGPTEFVFTFDNTYSRLRSKTLYYCVEVKEPSGKRQISFE